MHNWDAPQSIKIWGEEETERKRQTEVEDLASLALFCLPVFFTCLLYFSGQFKFSQENNSTIIPQKFPSKMKGNAGSQSQEQDVEGMRQQVLRLQEELQRLRREQ